MAAPETDGTTDPRRLEDRRCDDPTVAQHRNQARNGPPPAHPRYEVRGLLGSGGQGVVHRVFDGELEREVALKTLRPEDSSAEETRLFVREARAAAALEHPNIVPIYDVGTLADGRPFYTMRLVTGRSLADILKALARAPQDPTPQEWSLIRLVQVLQHACRALQCAHDREILHRDVKPSNMLVGSLGEVLVVDWGIARALRLPQADRELEGARGTPPWMSPEQARGVELDARTDVHALGVTLYQVLSLGLPWEADNSQDMLVAMLRDPPRRPEDVAPAGRVVPRELSLACMRALSSRREERLSSAAELDAELQAFLEGVRDRERRLEEARMHEAQATADLALHAASVAELAQAHSELERQEALHPAWEPVNGKGALLGARRRVEELEDAARSAFLRAVNGYTDALAYVPDHAPTRAALSGLFWLRFCEAEEARDKALAETFRALVERFHDGRHARDLAGHGSLAVDVLPEHAEVVLHPLVERDLVLVDGPGVPLGRGSVSVAEIAMGSYVLVATAPGYEPARHPACIRRSFAWRSSLRLLRLGTLPEGFVYIPGTEAWLGGDARANNPLPRQRVVVRSFALQRFMVTMRDYCEWLDDLERNGGAEPHVPRTGTEGPLCAREGSGHWAPNPELLFKPGTLARFGAESAWRLPAVGTSRRDADAYAAWRSRREGRCYRLPTGIEWEVAARGVDERIFPWGNTWDASLTHCLGSFAEGPDVAPIGTLPTDCSVFGVRDMAGCMAECTSSWMDEARDMAQVRGGSWSTNERQARSAFRGTNSSTARSTMLSFRLALDIEEA